MPGEAVRHRALRWTRRALIVVALLSLADAPRADVGAVTSRVQAARAALARAISDAGVDGRFIERIQGAYAFAPLQPDLPQATVSNPDEISPLAVGPVVHVSGNLDDDGWLKVRSFDIPTPRFIAAAGDAAGQAMREIITIVNGIVKRTTRAMAPQARALRKNTPDYNAIHDQIRTILRSYRDAVAKGTKDDATWKIADDWAKVRSVVGDAFSASDEYKAIYGSPDNYPPWSYDRIFRQSPAAVAIAEPGRTTSLCSGVLITKDLVLTAGHCFSGPPFRPPQKLEVWFGYTDAPGGGRMAIARRPIKDVIAPGPRRLPDLLKGKYGPKLQDYAIVLIDSVAPDPRASPASGPPEAIALARPQCVRSEPLHKGDPIYVLGYPRGDPVTVHDSARVYLPYRVQDGEEFTRLRLDIQADLIGVDGGAEAMDEFDHSYDRVTEKSIDWRVLRSVRDGGQPRMGIVADTFHGDSGGPVYDREREQCVVGILLQGSPDSGTRRRPNWKEHERVLPMTAILDDLSTDTETASVPKEMIVK